MCVCALATACGTGEDGVDDEAFCVLKIRAVKGLNIKKHYRVKHPLRIQAENHKNKRSSFILKTKNGKHHLAVQGHL